MCPQNIEKGDFMSYNISNLQVDLFNAMKSRPNGGVYSGRALGNSANIPLWTPDKIQSYFNGIVTAHNLFFTELSLKDFAQLIVCESCQESTGDYRLGVKPVDLNDHSSAGIIQVTPGSVLLDYQNWGVPIIDVTGKIILNPQSVLDLDLNDPGVCVVIWAFYTKNVVVMGVSLNEYGNRVAWNIPTGEMTRDFGNAQAVWLSGGGVSNDRHTTTGQRAYQDYYNRILDYYIASGFGTKVQFDNLLNTPLNNKVLAVYNIENNLIDNRDTCFGIDKIGIYS